MNNEALSELFPALYGLVAKLRGPGGCPWDARQTKETLAGYLLEEAYEVVEAVEQGRPEEIRDELGDLLFQILFLAYLGEEQKEFDISQVIQRIQAKMIRRHPHVFGQVKVQNAQEVTENWAKIKKDEKGDDVSLVPILKDIPKSLPALLFSHRILERTQEARNPDKKAEDSLGVLEDGILELRNISDQEQIGLKIGTLLFQLVDLARQQGLNAEQLLRARNLKFMNEIQEQES